ncbi:MAG TPA: hypothetical protein VJJ76_02340 [archaeon]|nr:hypothetical protein [archaeon]
MGVGEYIKSALSSLYSPEDSRAAIAAKDRRTKSHVHSYDINLQKSLAKVRKDNSVLMRARTQSRDAIRLTNFYFAKYSNDK